MTLSRSPQRETELALLLVTTSPCQDWVNGAPAACLSRGSNVTDFLSNPQSLSPNNATGGQYPSAESGKARNLCRSSPANAMQTVTSS